MSFGERLHKERKRKKLSADTLARACDLSRSYITLMENDKRLPGRKVIPKLALALDIKKITVVNWYLDELRTKLQ